MDFGMDTLLVNSQHHLRSLHHIGKHFLVNKEWKKSTFSTISILGKNKNQLKFRLYCEPPDGQPRKLKLQAL